MVRLCICLYLILSCSLFVIACRKVALPTDYCYFAVTGGTTLSLDLSLIKSNSIMSKSDCERRPFPLTTISEHGEASLLCFGRSRMTNGAGNCVDHSTDPMLVASRRTLYLSAGSILTSIKISFFMLSHKLLSSNAQNEQHRNELSSGSHHLPDSSSSPTHWRSNASSTIKYLNGLRGAACLIVFNFHFLYPYTWTIIFGFGTPLNETKSHHHIHQLPFLSLLYRGRAMVMLFFGISGYVLSRRYIGLLYAHAWDLSQKSLASIAPRRYPRLFLPPTVSMSMVMVVSMVGGFEPGRRFQDSPWRTGAAEQYPPRALSISGQLVDFGTRYWNWSRSVWQ